MDRYKHLTPEQRQQVLDSYRQTRSSRLTAEALGLSWQRVYRVLTTEGVEVTNHRPGACDRNRETVLRMVAEKQSLSAIARTVGTNKTRLREWLVRNGIQWERFDQSGANNPRWIGGRRVDEDGYILLFLPDHPMADSHGLVREHRLVMSQHLGRNLKPTEVVHHLDGNRQNNAIENLELFASNTAHLAATLKGQVPNHSEAGKERMRERGRRLGVIRQKPNPAVSTPDAAE